ncbi:MAG: hypothetical protein KBE04_04810 [Phycisphaerae bacterium]|nr:hypothetical protein [Phycisphaerae bacterium]
MRALLLTLLTCLIVLPANAKYSGGTGEPNDPYQIATAADLIALGNEPNDYDEHFILTADIDLDPNLPGRKVFDRAVIASSWETPFTGVFDGNEHIISRVTIQTANGPVGLFGLLESEAEVRDLGVVDVNITGAGGGVGGLAGGNVGTVTRCHSIGMVTGSGSVGALVGYNGLYATVTQCYSIGVVHGNDCGGLVGVNVGGTVTQCYSTGLVSGDEQVGGLIGINDVYEAGTQWSLREGFVSYCYSTSIVSGHESVGGLIGDNWGTVTQCFWDTETSGTLDGVGQVGPDPNGVIGKTTAEMRRAKTFLDAGWDFMGETANGTEDIWKIVEGVGYPRLSWEKYSGGTGEPNDPYQIATAADLIALGEDPNDYDKHFILTADIDLDPNLPGRKVFDRAVIGTFRSVCDGDGHTISHLTITGGGNTGLFGQLELGAEVKDLGVVDVNITGGGSFIGGLVGEDRGTVTRCYSTGSIKGASPRTSCLGGLVGRIQGGVLVDCRSVTSVVGGNYVGGLVGSMVNGSATRCRSTGTVNGSGYSVGGLTGDNLGGLVSQCTSGGSVSGGRDVGGLVGWNYGDGRILDSYSTAGVTAVGIDVGGLVGWNESNVFAKGHVTNSYSVGAAVGSSDVGGLVGCNIDGYGSRGEVIACFWDTQTSGQTKSGTGTGRTTAQMQTAATFVNAGWDFVGETANGTEDIWWINEGKDCPRLWWEATAAED